MRASDSIPKFPAPYTRCFCAVLEAMDSQCYPTLGIATYTTEEIRLCEATFDFLALQLDDEGRAKSNILQRCQQRAGTGATTVARGGGAAALR